MAESKNEITPRFSGYPRAVELPNLRLRNTEDANPVFRGQLLVIGAWLVSRLGFVQKYLWSNAGFDGLRKIPQKQLSKYAERFDPTVIPLSLSTSLNPPKVDLESFPRQPEGLSGRFYSITDYHTMYLSGELTPLAVAESLLPLILRTIDHPSRHSTAFITSHIQAILEAAEASTERYKAGAPLSIIDGVPTAIKDENDVAGYRTTGGRRKNDDFFEVAEKSTRPVQLLEDGGAIILGKLNMHELGSDTTNNNPNYGTPRNPYNDQYYTGGSSGGAGYVVAAGLVPFALGGDGGGSIRIPASFCGVYGLKPSHNRLEDIGSTVTVTGPLAATIDDLEIAYRIMAVPDPKDPISSLFAPPQTPILKEPGPSRYIAELWKSECESGMDLLMNKACSYFEKNGYERVEVNIPYAKEGQLAHAMTILAEMAARAKADPMNPQDWYSGLNPANKVLLAVGAQTPAQDYLLAQQLRNMIMQQLAYYFKKYPGLVIVSPTSPMTGWPIGSEADLKHGVTDGNTSIRNMEYVWLANFCGNPAISCPLGYLEPKKGQGKVPVGIMAMGEWGSEDNLLAWGRMHEKWFLGDSGRLRPSNWEDVVASAKTRMEADNLPKPALG
ncbi:related to glutamyl-tRNA(Gln) amidotransferase subunit A [Phialocephala subalpina]|uniref:Related to glutamyl-tRNA(Gln) amidotransferase subunit A n=1 Tax=Phialocephala subalpina TaxID=576137 RepID=A0A1L7XXM1_9HELO|nr:related to glutamyl-tRNA(Gln) amidotransferase subunit A [Phialocephala subalpina]